MKKYFFNAFIVFLIGIIYYYSKPIKNNISNPKPLNKQELQEFYIEVGLPLPREKQKTNVNFNYSINNDINTKPSVFEQSIIDHEKLIINYNNNYIKNTINLNTEYNPEGLIMPSNIIYQYNNMNNNIMGEDWIQTGPIQFIKPNAYGLGVHMNQFGGMVKTVSYP